MPVVRLRHCRQRRAMRRLTLPYKSEQLAGQEMIDLPGWRDIVSLPSGRPDTCDIFPGHGRSRCGDQRLAAPAIPTGTTGA
jgi:hypothetical protein